VIEVTCAIILDSGKILVTRRSEQMPHSLKWEFPGGKVREGETPESCIKREILEETGLEIKVERLFPTVKHTYEMYTIKLIPFVCSILEGTISLAEHVDYRWLYPDDLGQLDWLDADVEVVRMIRSRL
jgi:8-oxo-dGTP diphosphatase